MSEQPFDPIALSVQLLIAVPRLALLQAGRHNRLQTQTERQPVSGGALVVVESRHTESMATCMKQRRWSCPNTRSSTPALLQRTMQVQRVCPLP